MTNENDNESVSSSLGSVRDGKQNGDNYSSSENENEDDDSGKTEEKGGEDDEDNIFADGGGDEAETKKAFKGLNKDELDIFVSKPFSHDGKIYQVVFFGQHKCWYNTVVFFKVQLVNQHERKSKPVPDMIKKLDEFKLRVEYSQTNEQVFGKGKSYPKVRWYTIISADVRKPEKLETELKKLSTYFKAVHCERLLIKPGRRFMDFVTNSGSDNILNGLKKYMGDDEDVIMRAVNAELIELGKKTHVYHHGQTMDRFMADYYIKKVLVNVLGATSWESVPDQVKKICYKDFPRRSLPDWNKIFP